MRVTRVLIILTVGVLLALGACSSVPEPPTDTTPPPVTTPTNPSTTPPPTTTEPTNPPPTATTPTTPPPTTTTPTTPPTTTPPPTTPPPATGPANFVTSDLVIAPKKVEVEDVTSVSVKVTNTGGQSGTYTVVMKVDDGKHPTVSFKKDVTVDAGASQVVTFPLSEKELGEYIVTIDKLTALLSVEIF